MAKKAKNNPSKWWKIYFVVLMVVNVYYLSAAFIPWGIFLVAKVVPFVTLVDVVSLIVYLYKRRPNGTRKVIAYLSLFLSWCLFIIFSIVAMFYLNSLKSIANLQDLLLYGSYFLVATCIGIIFYLKFKRK